MGYREGAFTNGDTQVRIGGRVKRCRGRIQVGQQPDKATSEGVQGRVEAGEVEMGVGGWSRAVSTHTPGSLPTAEAKIHRGSGRFGQSFGFALFLGFGFGLLCFAGLRSGDNWWFRGEVSE